MANFCIAVCTAKRPRMLSRLLESLIRLSIPDGGTLSIIIIENDHAPSSLEIIDKYRAASSVPIKHHLESRIGIPYARNRAVVAALQEQADWIGMLDDDEYVSSNWLTDLYNACLHYKADVATGPVRKEFETPPPNWWYWTEEPLVPTGTLRRDAYTNNVLFNRSLIASDGLNLRFDERFIAGAEDINFFRRAYIQGARIVFVAEAMITETVPSTRVKLDRVLGRTYMVSSSNSIMGVIHEGRAKASMKRLPAIVRRAVVGLLMLIGGALAWPVKRAAGERIMVRGVISLTKAWGSLCGLAGMVSTYYLLTDGS